MAFTGGEKAFCVLQFAKCDGSTLISYTISKLIYQQDGAPPHFHHDFHGYLNDALPSRWIGRTSKDDSPLLPWPPRSPDLTPCDFFLWGYVKEHMFVPPYASRFSRAAIKDRACTHWF